MKMHYITRYKGYTYRKTKKSIVFLLRTELKRGIRLLLKKKNLKKKNITDDVGSHRVNNLVGHAMQGGSPTTVSRPCAKNFDVCVGVLL